MRSEERVAAGRHRRASRRLAPPAALTAAVVALGLVGALPRWPGILHEVALPPLDIFADVKVLMAQANGYPVFVLGLAASVWTRTLVLAALLSGIGSAGRGRRMVRLALRFYLMALPLAVLAAGFQFTAGAAVYHWDFWLGLALSLLAFFALAGVPAGSMLRASADDGGEPRLRRGFLASAGRGLDVRVLLPYLVALTFLGAAGRLAGRWGSVLLVPVSAALTRWALGRLVGRRRRSGLVPASLVILAMAFAAATGNAGIRLSGPAPASRGAVLFVVPGVDTASGQGSMFLLDPSTLGFSCGRVAYFSYAGPGPGARQGEASCPIRLGAPYTREDTQRPLAGFFAREVRAASAGGPVVVITHSQGAWIAWDAVASGRAPDVRAMILLGAVPRVSERYPGPGRSGPGQVGGDADRLLSSVGRALGVATFSPDAPLARELLATPGAAARVFSRSLPPGVRAVSVFSAFDLAVAPEGWAIPGVPTALVAVTHRGLPTSQDALGAANRLLSGGPAVEGRLGKVLWPVLPAFGAPPFDT